MSTNTGGDAVDLPPYSLSIDEERQICSEELAGTAVGARSWADLKSEGQAGRLGPHATDLRQIFLRLLQETSFCC